MTTEIADKRGAERVAVAVGEVAERGLAAEIGRRIVRLRKRRGWSQAELARRLGVTRMRLGNWERGVYTPPLGALLALRRELGVSLDELLTGRPDVPELGGGQKAVARKHLAGLMRLLGMSSDLDGVAAPEETRR